MDTLANLSVVLIFISAFAIPGAFVALSFWLKNPAPFVIGGVLFLTLVVTAFIANNEQIERGDHALQEAIETKYDVDVPLKDIEEGFAHNRKSVQTVWVIDDQARACTLDGDVHIKAHPVVDYVALICDGRELPTAN